jgi:phage terminase small subunit
MTDRPKRNPHPTPHQRVDENGLAPKVAKFVERYLTDMNATQAAIDVGYPPRSAASQASRLLKSEKVKAIVTQRIAERAARVQSKADDVLRDIIRIAHADPRTVFDELGVIKPIHEWPEEIAMCISGIDYSDKTGLPRIRFWSKVAMLELLAKHHGLVLDKHEVTGKDGAPLIPDKLGDPELLAKAREAIAFLEKHGPKK